MKKIALIFKVHQPFRLRKYRFFDIGENHDYYDDYQNKYALKRFAEQSYNKANALMKDALERYPKQFAFSFAFSGTAMDQMQWYAPELLADFQALAAHKEVEFLAEPYSCSLGSLISRNFFCSQVEAHRKKLRAVFKKTPSVLLNTDLIYSDEIGQWAAEMKFKGMVAEGARHI
ncbi:MAG: alpha-amylase, partial [Bacteroidales bacterium]|nr:alpha-amylase [Bacteroidales bacterium]